MQTDAPATDWSFDAGPQTDGTFITPDLGLPLQPTDAGGGPPAEYSDSILGIFKFGVNTWANQENNRQLLEYKRYDATQRGIYQQGQPALFGATANGQVPPAVWLFGGVILLVALLQHKG